MENPTLTGLNNEHIYHVKSLAVQGLLRQKFNSIIIACALAIFAGPASLCLPHALSQLL